VADTTVGWRFTNPRLRPSGPSLRETAEVVAELCGIGREAQDRFALESQRRAQAALAAGAFDDELVPVEVPRGGSRTDTVRRDEPPRADVTLASLAALKPAFRAGGTVTAGSSSGINDGAAALAIVSRTAAEELGLTPMARIVATAGVDPARMGLGPVPATRKARAGRTDRAASTWSS
jgi:acetyl-CoA acetyltransferase